MKTWTVPALELQRARLESPDGSPRRYRALREPGKVRQVMECGIRLFW